MKTYDICITGGGTAGCACAYIAAKLGLKTVLIEKNNYLGGLITGGLVIPVMKTDSGELNTKFFNALIKYAKKFGAQIEYKDGNKGWLNPNLLKIVLDYMLYDSGVEILFNMEPNKVYYEKNYVFGIDFCSNMLSLHIDSKYFLDSTGDSKIFQLLNLDFCNKNLIKQPASLRFIMSGVDIKKLKKFLEKIDPDRNVTNFCNIDDEIHLTSAYTWDNNNWNLKSVFDEALKNNDLEPFDTAYFQIFTVAGAKSSVAFNCPRLKSYNPNDPFEYSIALIEARQAIYRISKFMNKYFDGFQNAYISQIADLTGIRESNNIVSKEIVTKESLFIQKKYKNPVLSGDYPIDIHSNDKNKSVLSKMNKYYIGIDSLISKDFENLYAAGKNLGAEHEAQAALRTQKNCMSMGEAVAIDVFNKIKSQK